VRVSGDFAAAAHLATSRGPRHRLMRIRLAFTERYDSGYRFLIVITIYHFRTNISVFQVVINFLLGCVVGAPVACACARLQPVRAQAATATTRLDRTNLWVCQWHLSSSPNLKDQYKYHTDMYQPLSEWSILLFAWDTDPY